MSDLMETKEEEPALPFPYTSIPRQVQKERCAMIINHAPTPPITGRVGKTPNEWSLELIVDAGALGFPSLSVSANVRKTLNGNPFSKKEGEVFDTTTLRWYPGEVGNRAWLQKHPDLRKAGQEIIREVTVLEEQQQAYVMVLTCVLMDPQVVEFADSASQSRLALTVQAQLEALKRSQVSVSFIFNPQDGRTAKNHMPIFKRRVDESFGVLSQYFDPESGDTLLEKVQEAPTIKEVGGGMYLTDKPDELKQLPKQATYRFLHAFGVIHGLGPIRDFDISFGRHANMEKDGLPCFPMAIPKFPVEGKTKKIDRDQPKAIQDMDNYIFLYGRLPSGEDKKVTPEPGLRTKVEWDNAALYKDEQHLSLNDVGRKPPAFRGLVVRRPESELAATHTDFCIIMRKGAVSLPKVHRELKYIKSSLPICHIAADFSPDPFQRELDAINRLCDEAYTHAPTLAVRRLLMNGGKGDGKPDTTLDLHHLNKNPANQEVFKQRLKEAKRRLDNVAQLKTLEKLASIQNHVLCIQGPAGKGKTKTLVQLLWTLVELGHKPLVVAASNNVVDILTIGARSSTPWTCVKKNLLRIETGVRERDSIVQETRLEESSPTQPLPADKATLVHEDLRVQMAYATIIADDKTDDVTIEELEAKEEAIERLGIDVEAHQELLQQVRSIADFNKRPSTVPFDMTLGGRIRALMIRDRLKAEAEEAADCASTPSNQHQDIKPAKERNPSAEYADYYLAFVEQVDRLSATARTRFIELRDHMEARVYAETDMLFSSLNNIGSQDFEGLGFKPTVIVVDEAGQASMAALAVPLTQFSTWEALILAGDHKQLRPTVLAKNYSEVAETTCIPPLETLIKFKVDSIFLDQQYRMAPAIVHFPSKQFYGGQLRTHPSAMQDNNVRQRIRYVSQKNYNIQVPIGSEYWWIDVYKGESHPEEGGFSLRNFANADAIAKLLENLNNEGIAPEDITILSMYKAQMRLVFLRVTKIDGKLRYHEASTTDAFQGRESRVVILDLVSASRLAAYVGPGGVYPVDQYGTASSFVKDFHRINLALTRARDGLIVVGQWARFNRSSGRTEESNTLLRMSEDALKRKLVCIEDLEDVNPKSVRQRRERGLLAQEAALKSTTVEHRYRFYQDNVYAKARKMDNIAMNRERNLLSNAGGKPRNRL
ncbi:MAG: hypothetical protein Q9213_001177 [Squamulea squamosa]